MIFKILLSLFVLSISPVLAAQTSISVDLTASFEEARIQCGRSSVDDDPTDTIFNLGGNVAVGIGACTGCGPPHVSNPRGSVVNFGSNGSGCSLGENQILYYAYLRPDGPTNTMATIYAPFEFINPADFNYTLIEIRHFFHEPCPSGFIHQGRGNCIRFFDEIDMAKNPPTCPAEGNPINVATGNKYQLETDFGGSGDFALSLSRHYNSFKPFNSVLGQQWRHNYERWLVVSSTSNTPFIQVNRHDGVTYTYTQQNGQWVTDADVIESLVQTSNGFRLMTANNVIEDYGTSGRLLSMTNTRNQTITLSYNATSGLLETVTDHFGRSLSFNYDVNGRFISFDDPDSNTYRYEYDAAGNLEKVIYPDSTPNDLSDNPQRLYVYENINHPSHLTGIIDETGARFASWGYDTEGRGIFSEHNNGTERVDIVYNSDGTTTVTDQIGAVRTYTFDVMFGVAKTVNVEGDQCTTCGSNAQAITYDPNGFVNSRTDFNGNVANFTRDNRGLVLTRTEAVGTAQQRTITTTWHPNFRLPLQIAEPNKTTAFTYDTNGNLLSRVETNTGTPQ